MNNNLNSASKTSTITKPIIIVLGQHRLLSLNLHFPSTKTIIIVLAILSILLIISFIIIRKPFKILSYNDNLNTFVSGNHNVKFNYPKEFKDPVVNYESELEAEIASFENYLSISYWWFEGFFGPFKSTETVKTKDGKECNLNLLTQGFQSEYYGIFAQCSEDPNDFRRITLIWQIISPSELDSSLGIVKSIIESMEFNTNIKII